jgi:hypothetical protein
VIVCSRCRTENPDGAQHCTSCRAYLGWSRQSDAPARPQTPPPDSAPPPPQPGHPQPGYPRPGYPQPGQGHSQPGQQPDPYAGYGDPYGQQPPQAYQQPPQSHQQPPSHQPPPGHPSGATQAQRVPPPPPGPSYRDGAAPRQGPPRVPPPPPPPPSRRSTNTVQLGRSGTEAPRRAERSIGVSFAPPPSARTPNVPPPPGPARGGPDFDAVLPQEQLSPAQRQAASRSALAVSTANQPISPGQVRCRTCGTPVSEDRRFCRCGAILHSRSQSQQLDAPHAKLPWYRRLGEMFGGGRDFRRSMRSANRGLRVVYDAGLGARAQLFRATMYLGILGIGASQLGPWGGNLRSQAYQRVNNLLPHSYVNVPVEHVQTDPATKDSAAFPVKYAVDGDPSLAWAVPWTPVTVNGKPCQGPTGAAALVVTFRGPTKLNKITISAGLGKDNPDRAVQARPKTIEVATSDGNCTPVDLADKPDPQQFTLKGDGITFARLSIVDTYPAQSASGPQLVALSEVSFQQRQ